MQNTNQSKVKEIKKLYNATGFVVGNLWGGGKGIYPSESFWDFNSKRSLINEAKKMLESGSLDSGMGYESLIGALLEIEEIKIIKYKRDKYKSSKSTIKYIGKMTEEDRDCLQDIYYNNY